MNSYKPDFVSREQHAANLVGIVTTLFMLVAFFSHAFFFTVIVAIAGFLSLLLHLIARNWIGVAIWTFNTITWTLICVYGFGFMRH